MATNTSSSDGTDPNEILAAQQAEQARAAEEAAALANAATPPPAVISVDAEILEAVNISPAHEIAATATAAATAAAETTAATTGQDAGTAAATAATAAADAASLTASTEMPVSNAVADSITSIPVTDTKSKNVFISHGPKEVYDKFIELAAEKGKAINKGGRWELHMSPKAAAALYEVAAQKCGSEAFADIAHVKIPRDDSGFVNKISSYFSSHQVHIVAAGSKESVSKVMQETANAFNAMKDNGLLAGRHKEPFEAITLVAKSSAHVGDTQQSTKLGEVDKTVTLGTGKPLEIVIGKSRTPFFANVDEKADGQNGWSAFKQNLMESVKGTFVPATVARVIKGPLEEVNRAIEVLADKSKGGVVADRSMSAAFASLNGLKDDYSKEAQYLGGLDRQKALLNVAVLLVKANEGPGQYDNSQRYAAMVAPKVEAWLREARTGGVQLSMDAPMVKDHLDNLVKSGVITETQKINVGRMVDQGTYNFKLEAEIQKLPQDKRDIVQEVTRNAFLLREEKDPDKLAAMQGALRTAASSLGPDPSISSEIKNYVQDTRLEAARQSSTNAKTPIQGQIDRVAEIITADPAKQTLAELAAAIPVINSKPALTSIIETGNWHADSVKTLGGLNAEASEQVVVAIIQKTQDPAAAKEGLKDMSLADVELLKKHVADNSSWLKQPESMAQLATTMSALDGAILNKTPAAGLVDQLAAVVEAKQPNKDVSTLSAAELVAQTQSNTDFTKSIDTISTQLLQRLTPPENAKLTDPALVDIKASLEALKTPQGAVMPESFATAKEAVNNLIDERARISSAAVSTQEQRNAAEATFAPLIADLATNKGATASTESMGKLTAAVEGIGNNMASLALIPDAQLKELREVLQEVKDKGALTDTAKDMLSAITKQADALDQGRTEAVTGKNLGAALDKLSNPGTPDNQFVAIATRIANATLSTEDKALVATRMQTIVTAVADKTEKAPEKTREGQPLTTEQKERAADARLDAANKKLDAVGSMADKLEGQKPVAATIIKTGRAKVQSVRNSGTSAKTTNAPEAPAKGDAPSNLKAPADPKTAVKTDAASTQAAEKAPQTYLDAKDKVVLAAKALHTPDGLASFKEKLADFKTAADSKINEGRGVPKTLAEAQTAVSKDTKAIGRVIEAGVEATVKVFDTLKSQNSADAFAHARDNAIGALKALSGSGIKEGLNDTQQTSVDKAFKGVSSALAKMVDKVKDAVEKINSNGSEANSVGTKAAPQSAAAPEVKGRGGMGE